MQRSQPQPLGALLAQLIEDEPRLAKGIYEQRAIEAFLRRFDKMRHYIGDVFVRHDILYIQTRSSTVANYITEQKELIVDLINHEIHYNLLQGLRTL